MNMCYISSSRSFIYAISIYLLIAFDENINASFWLTICTQIMHHVTNVTRYVYAGKLINISICTVH